LRVVLPDPFRGMGGEEFRGNPVSIVVEYKERSDLLAILLKTLQILNYYN